MASFLCHGFGGTKQVRLERIVRHGHYSRSVDRARRGAAGDAVLSSCGRGRWWPSFCSRSRNAVSPKVKALAWHCAPHCAASCEHIRAPTRSKGTCKQTATRTARSECVRSQAPHRAYQNNTVVGGVRMSPKPICARRGHWPTWKMPKSNEQKTLDSAGLTPELSRAAKRRRLGRTVRPQHGSGSPAYMRPAQSTPSLQNRGWARPELRAGS